MAIWKSLTAGMLALSLLTPAAIASDNKDPNDVLGTWTFQTQPYRQGTCSMSGQMMVTENPEEGLYDCELTAVEECETLGKSVVVQSCKVRRTRNQIAVRSIIEQMVEQKMEGLIYVPDNFALTVQSENYMYGSLISAVSAPVEFRRIPGGIS